MSQEESGLDELSIQERLSGWLTGHGAKVLWGDSNDRGYDTFSLSSSRKRPDLLVLTGTENIVVEVKDATQSSNVYDGMRETHEYWKLCEWGDCSVQIGDTNVGTDTFVVATQFSPDGHLFKPDREGGCRQTYNEDDHDWNKTGRPPYEYRLTETVPRTMWRYAWSEAGSRGLQNNEIQRSIGALLSRSLDGDPQLGEQGAPKLLTYDGDRTQSWRGL